MRFAKRKKGNASAVPAAKAAITVVIARSNSRIGLISKGRAAIDDWFQRQIIGLCVRRLIMRLLLPMPIRVAVTLWRAFGYWGKALDSLLEANINVAVLDGAAVAVAIVQGPYNTENSIVFLLSLSGLLESYTRHFIVKDEKIELTAEQQARIYAEGAECSLLYLTIGEKLAGVLCINDPPRSEAAETISAALFLI